MPIKNAACRALVAAASLAALLALPQIVQADDDKAARAAAASDPQYSAGYLNSWVAMQKMKPMDVMHMVDTDKKGYVTKEEFTKFQEELFGRMDRDHDGKVSAQEWMGTGASRAAKK